MSWNQSSSVAADVRDERVSAFLSKVYGWMFAGLLITSVTAFTVASKPALIEALILNRILLVALIFGQLGLVYFLSARANKMAPTTTGDLRAFGLAMAMWQALA